MKKWPHTTTNNSLPSALLQAQKIITKNFLNKHKNKNLWVNQIVWEILIMGLSVHDFWGNLPSVALAIAYVFS